MQDYYNKTNKEVEYDLVYLKNLINRYIIYYDFVYKHKKECELLFFDDIVKDPLNKLNDINLYFNLNIEKDILNESLVEFNTLNIKKQNKKPLERTSLPNEKRNDRKVKIKELITKMPNFEKANNIYLKLNNYQN